MKRNFDRINKMNGMSKSVSSLIIERKSFIIKKRRLCEDPEVSGDEAIS